jgi:ribonuclease BN (tRNA processing enzyme)
MLGTACGPAALGWESAMEVLFIGVSSCIPEAGGDTACFLINGRHPSGGCGSSAAALLVDTGWRGALGLRELGVDPVSVESVVLTHLHQDHYLWSFLHCSGTSHNARNSSAQSVTLLQEILLYYGCHRNTRESVGLPQMLFYRAMCAPRPQAPLRIIGPAEHLEEVVASAMGFLQVGRFPELQVELEVVGLRPDDECDVGGIRLHTCAARHVSGTGVPEPSLSWRATETNTGAALAFSGDTSYNPDLAQLARGVHTIIHDAAHSNGREAAQVAQDAGAARLFLIHYDRQSGQRILEEARRVFPESYLAEAGQRVTV